jgi:cytochrome c-type biogenesis protein
MTVTIGLAFLAGMASFLLPCVFSILPAYVSYLGGRSIGDIEKNEAKKSILIAFFHGMAFFAGFAPIFILLVSGPLSLVGPIYVVRPWLPKILGVIIVLFGLQMMGIFRIPFLVYDLQPRSNFDHLRGYFSSALIGLLFSAGWVSCSGKVLGEILSLMMNGGSEALVFQLLLAYTIGIAIPFLLVASGLGWLTFILRRYRKVDHYVGVAMGILLAAVGAMLFLGIYDIFTRMSPFIDLGL